MLKVSFRSPLCKPPDYIPSVSHVSTVTLTQGTADEDGTGTWAKSLTHSFLLVGIPLQSPLVLLKISTLLL